MPVSSKCSAKSAVKRLHAYRIISTFIRSLLNVALSEKYNINENCEM